MNENNGDAASDASWGGWARWRSTAASRPIPAAARSCRRFTRHQRTPSPARARAKGSNIRAPKTPTRLTYERCVVALEGDSRGFAFVSTTSTVPDLPDSGSHVVAIDDVYGGTCRLFERVRYRSAGLDFSFVDLTRPGAFEAMIRSSHV